MTISDDVPLLAKIILSSSSKGGRVNAKEESGVGVGATPRGLGIKIGPDKSLGRCCRTSNDLSLLLVVVSFASS